MIWRLIDGGVKQLIGIVKHQRRQPGEESLGVVPDEQDHLADKVQDIYGVTKSEANKKLSGWLKIQQDTADPGNKTSKPR